MPTETRHDSHYRKISANTQNNCCAICGNPPSDDRALALDHDHQTGVLRDLLCTNCNVGLGNFRDDPDLLARAADYLAYHRGPRFPSTCRTCRYWCHPRQLERQGDRTIAIYVCPECGTSSYTIWATDYGDCFTPDNHTEALKWQNVWNETRTTRA